MKIWLIVSEKKIFIEEITNNVTEYCMSSVSLCGLF